MNFTDINEMMEIAFEFFEEQIVKNPEINLKEPPCRECLKFAPRITLTVSSEKSKFNGIILCTADSMENDFSCYVPRESMSPEHLK